MFPALTGSYNRRRVRPFEVCPFDCAAKLKLSFHTIFLPSRKEKKKSLQGVGVARPQRYCVASFQRVYPSKQNIQTAILTDTMCARQSNSDPTSSPSDWRIFHRSRRGSPTLVVIAELPPPLSVYISVASHALLAIYLLSRPVILLHFSRRRF